MTGQKYEKLSFVFQVKMSECPVNFLPDFVLFFAYALCNEHLSAATDLLIMRPINNAFVADSQIRRQLTRELLYTFTLCSWCELTQVQYATAFKGTRLYCLFYVCCVEY